jgi:hypothetical protein
MDRFLEQAVSKHKRTLDEIMYYLSWVVMIVSAVLAFMVLNVIFIEFSVAMLVMLLVFAGIAVYLFFFHDRLRTEYEYTFTNGSMDFAMVFNNCKRKNLGSLNVAKVDAFGKVASGSFHRHVSAPGVKQLRWFLNRDAELYYFAYSKDGQKSILVFEPNEEMVDNIRHYLPYGVYQEN